MSIHNSVIAVYDTHTDAELAIKEIAKAGFDMKNLSIIGKDYSTEEHAVGYYNTGDRVKFWGKLGAFWGGIWGLMFGSAFFFVPGIGPVMILGPIAGMIFAALESAVIVGGLSALGASLFSMGIPKDSVLLYETDIKTGKFLVVAHGTDAELTKVQGICAARSENVKFHAALMAATK